MSSNHRMRMGASAARIGVERKKRWFMRVVVRLLTIAALACAVAAFALPIVLMVGTSLKEYRLIFTVPPKWLFKPTVEHYVRVFAQTPILRCFENSMIVAITTTSITLVAAIPAAYAIARLRFPGREEIAFFLVLVRMVPTMALILPVFLIARSLGLLNTRTSIVLVHTLVNVPFVIWLMQSFFVGVPVEMEESALVDGCTRIGALIRVVIPVVLPGLLVSAVFTFLYSWNEFAFAMILSGPSTQTLPVMVQGLRTPTEILWGQIFAVSSIIAAPVFIFTWVIQRFFVQGMTSGAIKG